MKKIKSMIDHSFLYDKLNFDVHGISQEKGKEEKE